MCHKKGYASYDHAKADAKAMRRKTHVAFNVYRCRICHHWHVGSRRVDERIADKRGGLAWA